MKTNSSTPYSGNHNKVPATSFLATLSVNVDNAGLSDADFREFVRRSLDVVDFPRPSREVMDCVQRA